MKNYILNIVRKFAKRINSKNINKTKWDNGDIESDDVFFVSYPRSGNTWLRFIMTNLRFPEAEWNIKSLAAAFPEIRGMIHPSYAPKPRWIKSHEPYSPEYPKVVYLVRDGRDVSVSFYHWSGDADKMTFKEFIDKTTLSNRIHSSGGWHKHVLSWLDNSNNETLHIIKYEELLNNPITSINQLCDFIGLDRTVNEIQEALSKSSYDNIQNKFKNFRPYSNKNVGIRGSAGAWKDYFNDELNKYYKKIAGDAMEYIGYSM